MRSLAAVGAFVIAVGCSRAEGAAPIGDVDAGVAVPSVASAAPVGGARLSTGEHEYRGTLGTTTAVAMHLVRTGDSLNGFYVYLAIGRPIGLIGTIDAAGAMELSEDVDGKTTGTWRLRAAGSGLAGEWTNMAGNKTFAVRLSPGSPWVAKQD
jgi:hypothetical protein